MIVAIYKPTYKLEVEVKDLDEAIKVKNILKREGFNSKIIPINNRTVKVLEGERQWL